MLTKLTTFIYSLLLPNTRTNHRLLVRSVHVRVALSVSIITLFASTQALSFTGLAALPPSPHSDKLDRFDAVSHLTDGADTIYLPLIQNEQPQQVTQLFHVPYFNVPDVLAPGAGRFDQMAVFWFGQITPTDNYADVRLGFNDEALYVYFAVVDRLLWYNQPPVQGDLTAWDAVSLYLDNSQHPTTAPTSNSYRFVAQSAPPWDSRVSYQIAYHGNGTAWIGASIPFTTNATYRGNGYNNNAENAGWTMGFTIPFSSLGLAGRPKDDSHWHLGITLHNRDDVIGTPMAPKLWPGGMQPNRPATWGNVAFGLPSFSPPVASYPITTTVRQGLNGMIVKDGAVGGFATCGDGLDFWTAWGTKVYAAYDQVNIQNEADISDRPCFSKYYVTFPLDAIPANAVVISATLTLHQFGNSGANSLGPPYPSLIQVFSVADDWDPATLNWNNAPLPMENVGQAWVGPLPSFPAWPGVPRKWDLSRAVSNAVVNRQPLRLVLYSADGAYNSGKYFVASETGDWNAVARPTLDVFWGVP